MYTSPPAHDSASASVAVQRLRSSPLRAQRRVDAASAPWTPASASHSTGSLPSSRSARQPTRSGSHWASLPVQQAGPAGERGSGGGAGVVAGVDLLGIVAGRRCRAVGRTLVVDARGTAAPVVGDRRVVGRLRHLHQAVHAARGVDDEQDVRAYAARIRLVQEHLGVVGEGRRHGREREQRAGGERLQPAASGPGGIVLGGHGAVVLGTCAIRRVSAAPGPR